MDFWGAYTCAISEGQIFPLEKNYGRKKNEYVNTNFRKAKTLQILRLRQIFTLKKFITDKTKKLQKQASKKKQI